MYSRLTFVFQNQIKPEQSRVDQNTRQTCTAFLGAQFPGRRYVPIQVDECGMRILFSGQPIGRNLGRTKSARALVFYLTSAVVTYNTSTESLKLPHLTSRMGGGRITYLLTFPKTRVITRRAHE